VSEDDVEAPNTSRDPLAAQVISDISDEAPTDGREWVEFERRIQELHPLASIVTRTRKRDVKEHAATRKSYVVPCNWTDEEDSLYQRLVEGSTHYGWICERLTFGQVQRARQAASCLPAAAASHLNVVESDDEAVELTDILPSEASRSGQGNNRRSLSVTDSAPVSTDSKYNKFREILDLIWSEDPIAKVLVFTFFVGTAKYLETRLASEGFPALRIAGDIPSNPHLPDKDERGKRILQFKDDPSIRVLVSTEVGSEGLDFQFCHHLINYDLPWNPMVVEQRIGRIDRFGQASDVVNIHSLVVQGTVEDRILRRLYERIGIFEESIGDLEVILGETVSELQRDYVNGKLTPAEADARVEQAARAISQRRIDLDKLEEEAGELFGHEEFIRSEMERVGRLGRYVTGEAMLALLRTFLESNHPSVGLWEDVPEIHALRLTDDLRRDIQVAARGITQWFDRSLDDVLRFTFSGEIAFQHSDVELLNATHPLIRAAVTALTARLENAMSRVSQAVLQLAVDGDSELKEGLYFLAVFTHTVKGIRSRRLIETIAWSEDAILDQETGERVLHLVLERGSEWDTEQNAPALPAEVWSALLGEARRRYRALKAAEERENEALYFRRRSSLEAEFKYERQRKQARLRTAELRGKTRVIPAFRGQVQKVEADFAAKLSELDSNRPVTVLLSDPIAFCSVRVMRSVKQSRTRRKLAESSH
jgi:hypothetical protein